jgi:starch phosphorylase
MSSAPFFYKHQGMDADTIRRSLANHLLFLLGKDAETATKRDWFTALAYTIRDRLAERWNKTKQIQKVQNCKRLYYLSLEFLPGKMLINNILALGIQEECEQALGHFGVDLQEIAEFEPEMALGNGGLGRLASCLLESMATLGLPGDGFGIRYEYGLFNQRVRDGYQVEQPDNWLRYGVPWEIPRSEILYPVRFYGEVHQTEDERVCWSGGSIVMAMAYDVLMPGHRTDGVNTLRLWSAKGSRDFDLGFFNAGEYTKAVEAQVLSENLSRVLYPADHTDKGTQLRLKQEYFFVSAALQDILVRFRERNTSLRHLPDKVAIQLNDTHPALAIPELMRVLMDEHGLDWLTSWDITVRTFSYTNHTLLPESLETWPVELLETLLPRHLQIIYEINHHFLNDVRSRYPTDTDLIREVSLIDESHPRRIRMAYLAIVGSHKVNGVSPLHVELMKTTLFANFERLFPGKIEAIVNAVTPRRWMNQCNPRLAGLLNEHLGSRWVTDLGRLRRLEPLADDEAFQAAFRSIKQHNKQQLAALIAEKCHLHVDPESLFDVQIKRIHEYKRQLLNILHVVTLYNRLRADPSACPVPRTVMFAGKAAPGYLMARTIIKLVNDVADVVNYDSSVGDRLRVVFLPNYNVTAAERIIPAAELSEQISTAGTEASGTGNMKLALNGALTIGTLDGANIDICGAVGEENFFAFGMTADQVARLRESGYDPWKFYYSNKELRQALDMIGSGYFSPQASQRYENLIASLLEGGDRYMVLADYADYVACQERVSRLYESSTEWTRKAILNFARMGNFSSDRAVREYARRIWQIEAVPLPYH